MNGISMNMKCACGAYHVAGTAAIAISKNVFIAEPFGSAFFLSIRHSGFKPESCYREMASPSEDHAHISAKALSGQSDQVRHDVAYRL